MKKNKLPSLIAILILTLITSLVWVGLSIYRAFSIKPSPSVPDAVSEPLNPALDTQTLGSVQSKIFLDDSQIPEIKITSGSTPQPTIIPLATPIASPSAIPTQTPSTSSGTI